MIEPIARPGNSWGACTRTRAPGASAEGCAVGVVGARTAATIHLCRRIGSSPVWSTTLPLALPARTPGGYGVVKPQPRHALYGHALQPEVREPRVPAGWDLRHSRAC